MAPKFCTKNACVKHWRNCLLIWCSVIFYLLLLQVSFGTSTVFTLMPTLPSMEIGITVSIFLFFLFVRAYLRTFTPIKTDYSRWGTHSIKFWNLKLQFSIYLFLLKYIFLSEYFILKYVFWIIECELVKKWTYFFWRICPWKKYQAIWPFWMYP